MDEKEIQKLFEDFSKKQGEAAAEAAKKVVADATKGLITIDVLNERLEKSGLKENIIKEINEAVEKQGLEIQKMLAGKGTSEKSIEEIVAEKADALKGLSDGSQKELKFRVSAKTMVQSGSLTGSTLSYREQAIGQLASPNTVFDKVFRTVNLSEADLKASNGVITYMDVTAETNNAAETAESTGTTVGTGNKPESAITWQEYNAALRVIADTIPVTRNSYRHLGFIAGEIDRLLRKNQAQRKDTQIYRGDGIAPNLKGIYTYTTAVTLASMPQYQGVINPNIADLSMNLSVYVSNKSDASGAQSKYAPNVLFINPADALRFFVKGSDGHYAMPPFMQNSGRVGNLQIIESPKVTVNTMMVGDASYGTIYQSEDVVIEMGLVNDQFLKNQWTIRAEQELCFLQRNADLGAFVKVTDITAAIAALSAP
jgi:RNA-binding protein YhbY